MEYKVREKTFKLDTGNCVRFIDDFGSGFEFFKSQIPLLILHYFPDLRYDEIIEVICKDKDGRILRADKCTVGGEIKRDYSSTPFKIKSFNQLVYYVNKN